KAADWPLRFFERGSPWLSGDVHGGLLLSWLNIIGIAIGLAMDAAAVSIAAGLTIRRLTGRHVFRLAWHFGLFQFMMPILGWLAGTTVATHIAAYDHWLAFGLLGFIGGKMLFEGLSGNEEQNKSDPTRGLMLVTLSIATSIDALAVGLSIAFLQVSVWLPSIIIGLVAGALTTVGVVFGSRLGKRWQRRAEIAGGCILILIGIRILISHIWG
ncbi:MAG: manganese efflux pump MntP family protein, partial [Armatimonadota bacterium]